MAAKVKFFTDIDSEQKDVPLNVIAGWSIYLDERFQSWARWLLKEMIYYTGSVLLGKASSNIVLADIQQCYDNSENEEDKLYYSDLLERGFQYISVDGNNRCTTIRKIVDDIIGFEFGHYSINKKVFQINKYNSKWSTMDSALKSHILEKKPLRVEIITRATNADLADEFLRINNGVKHNPQEKRNAKYCDIADAVRDLAKKYEKVLKLFIEMTLLKRRKGDEVVAEMIIHGATDGSFMNLSKGTLDSEYDDESITTKSLKKGIASTEKTLKLLKNYQKSKLDFSSGKPFGSVLNLHMFVVWMDNNNIAWSNGKKFYEWWLKGERKRRSSKDLVANVGDFEATYSGLLKFKTELYINFRLNLMKKDFAEDENAPIDFRDAERCFSKSQRYDMWVIQNGKCTETGKNIPVQEINDASKWAADHYPILHSKNGPTTVDNGRLIDYEAHKAVTSNQQMKSVTRMA